MFFQIVRDQTSMDGSSGARDAGVIRTCVQGIGRGMLYPKRHQ